MKKEENNTKECDFCDGTGYMTIGGADIISDPPIEVLCDECGGSGRQNLD